jgi:hypothetical protein
MEYTVYTFGSFVENLYKAKITDLSASGTDIRLAIMTSAYTPDQENDDNWSQMSTHQATGVNYPAGGFALASKTVTRAALVAMFDAADINVSTVTVTGRWGVIYDNTPASAANKKVIGYVDFLADVVLTAGVFKLVMPATGISRISVDQ